MYFLAKKQKTKNTPFSTDGYIKKLDFMRISRNLRYRL
nr:MAG TPA: hypothetical protein [Caudoviricetes sp.]DAT55298.1 MAG TPA: hypothetical protein [Caudoviricetes sp.]DAY60938.1 MAG TPA: hypothetical protein [Caudoviricetes sp.]